MISDEDRLAISPSFVAQTNEDSNFACVDRNSCHAVLMFVRRLAVFVVSLFVLSIAPDLHAQQLHAVTLDCPASIDTVKFAPLFVGDSITDTLLIRNTISTDTDFSIASVGDSSDFMWDVGQNSFVLPPNSLVDIPFRFIPQSDGEFATTYLVRGARPVDSCGVRIHVTGIAALETPPNSVINLLFPSSSVIGVRARDTAGLQLYFRNNSGTSLTIEGLSLRTDSDFHLDTSAIGSGPWTIAPGDSLPVRFRFERKTIGISVDSFVVKPADPTSTESFVLVGERLQDAAVPRTASLSHFSVLYPNPASSEVMVRVAELHHAYVRVIDMLGREVVSASIQSDWHWELTENDSRVAAGTYLVVVRGVSDSGEEIEEVQRLIVKP